MMVQFTNPDQIPKYSPDGSKIIFIRGGWMGSNELLSIDSDGRNERQLFKGNVRINHINFSPDGLFIVFSSTIPSGIHL